LHGFSIRVDQQSPYGNVPDPYRIRDVHAADSAAPEGSRLMMPS
jgi:hypothetical protein